MVGSRSILRTRLLRGMLLLALTAAAGARADDATSAFKPALPDFSRYMQGRFVYERNCAVCHGATGRGDGEMGRELVPKPRSFRTGLFKYRSTPPGKLPTDADLEKTVRHGVPATSMPIFDKLPQADVRAVIEYVKFFSRRWNDPANYAPPLRLPETPAWMGNPALRAAAAKRGRETFLMACASCHGETGGGNGPAAATLMDAWNEPIRPANLRQRPARIGAAPEDVYRLLLTGIEGTPMPAFGEVLDEETRWAVVAHVLELRAPEAAAGGPK